MTKQFTKLYSDFWINPDNAELMQLETDAKLMAIYLQGNSHHNMLGVYYLPILYVTSDLKQSIKKVKNALKKLCDISYCRYDEQTQYIWVCNMTLEQIGEDINAKDNRIKAVQSIWDNLPIKIEFLSEVYNKYHTIFKLKSRFTDSLCNNTQNNSSVVKFNELTQQNIKTSVDTNNSINLNLDKGSSINNYHTSSEGSSKELTNIFETSKDLIDHFEPPSKDLQSPSEAPSEGLRSNIEYISKNIEEINKKKEIDLKKTEKKEKKKTNNVLSSNSVVQTQPYFENPPEVFNSLSLNHTNSVANSSLDATVTIFEHWKTTMGYPKSKLDCNRRGWIHKALKDYSIEQLCEAVMGCSLTPHNMGDNKQGERYDGLHVIFKDANQIERFIRNFHHPPRSETKAQKQSRKNLQVAKEWAEQKTNKSRSNYV